MGLGGGREAKKAEKKKKRGVGKKNQTGGVRMGARVCGKLMGRERGSRGKTRLDIKKTDPK